MSNHTRLATAMRQILNARGVQEVTASGEFSIPSAKIVLFPGAVYGFGVCLDNKEKLVLFEEAQDRRMTRLAKLEDFKPIEGALYPIYWGKDKQLGARPHQHLNDPSGTGSTRLSTFSSLNGKALVCAVLVVPDYAEAEGILQQAFPGLLKTTTKKYGA